MLILSTIFSPVVRRKAHPNDVSMDINDVVQRIKKLRISLFS